MEPGSPLGETLCGQIVQRFQNKVSQLQIVKNWGISLSTDSENPGKSLWVYVRVKTDRHDSIIMK